MPIYSFHKIYTQVKDVNFWRWWHHMRVDGTTNQCYQNNWTSFSQV